jgi:hypothetical protein
MGEGWGLRGPGSVVKVRFRVRVRWCIARGEGFVARVRVGFRVRG